MEAHNATTVESITELTAGDTVTVSGNGLDVTTEVGVIKHDSWKGKQTAMLNPVDGNTWTLTDTNHPLQSDGIMSNNGAVTVELHE